MLVSPTTSTREPAPSSGRSAPPPDSLARRELVGATSTYTDLRSGSAAVSLGLSGKPREAAAVYEGKNVANRAKFLEVHQDVWAGKADRAAFGGRMVGLEREAVRAEQGFWMGSGHADGGGALEIEGRPAAEHYERWFGEVAEGKVVGVAKAGARREPVTHGDTKTAMLWPILFNQGGQCTDKNEAYSATQLDATSLAVSTMNADQLANGGQAVLTDDLMLNLFDAEKSRLDWKDRLGEPFGIGNQFGIGQVSKAIEMDVFKNHSGAIQAFQDGWNKAHPERPISAPDIKNWKKLAKDPIWGPFFATAGLQTKIDGSEKPGRTQEDAVNFGVAKYHGNANVLIDAQDTVSDLINWAPVAAEVKKKNPDWIDYVNEVVGPRNSTECTPPWIQPISPFIASKSGAAPRASS